MPYTWVGRHWSDVSDVSKTPLYTVGHFSINKQL